MNSLPENYPADFERALLERGGSAKYARKMRRTAERFQDSPQAALVALAPTVTQATIHDLVTRLRIFGNWMERAHPAEANPWLELTRLEAGFPARDRAWFEPEQVKALLTCERIPRHRRAFYRVQATLGLRPVEAGRLKGAHIVRAGKNFAVRLPASCQKSGREDQLTATAKEVKEIRANLPLLRKPLDHFERTFLLDISYAGVAAIFEGINRRMYDLRSFYVDQLFESGMHPREVQGLARHADIVTTLRHYARYKSRKAGLARAGIFQPLT